MREFLAAACAITTVHRRVICLTGLRPFKLPHTRGEPLVNPPKRLCGARIPRRKKRITLGFVHPAKKALDNFDFSPFLRILVSQCKHLTL